MTVETEAFQTNYCKICNEALRNSTDGKGAGYGVLLN